MFATSYNLFPGYMWLATVALAAALPPWLLAWCRRGRLSGGLVLATFAGVLLCGSVASLDVWNYWQLHRAGVLPDDWVAWLAPDLCRVYGGFFLRSAGVVFACSGVLTLLVGVVPRLVRKQGRPQN